MTEETAEPTHLSPWWRHATILVMIAGFSVLTLVTVLTYTNAPPIPGRIADASGATLVEASSPAVAQSIAWPRPGNWPRPG